MEHMDKLTNEQWERYEAKYGKLMHSISLKISGDKMTASPEDNYSELCIAALESINGFFKKTGLTFDESFDTKLFDQYTKTVLWNRKAKKGIPLSKKMDFRKKNKSLDAPMFSNSEASLAHLIEDPRSHIDVSSVDFNDFMKDQNDDVKTVMNAVLKDPSLLSKQGFIKTSAICRSTPLSIHFVNQAVDKIKSIMKGYND